MIEQGAPRPRVHLDIEGVQVEVLIDTGSTHTLVDQKTVHRLPRMTMLQKAPQVQGITRHELNVRRACVVKIGGIPTHVLVCKKLEGIDLLISANLCTPRCIVDFQQRPLL